MSKPTCCWLLSEPCKFPATYCGKAVSFCMVHDDDGTRVRKYFHLCDEHLAAAAKLPPDEDDSFSEPLLPADVVARMIKQEYPAPPENGDTIHIVKPKAFK